VVTPAPKRRCFRFSLRTLFVVVTVFGVWLGWVTYELNWIRQRHEFIAGEKRIHERRGAAVAIAYTYPGKRPARAPFMLWAFGEGGFSDMCVLADEVDTQRLTENDMNRVRQARRLFPEAEVMVAHERLVPSGTQFVGA
jgi:hypothetical protein